MNDKRNQAFAFQKSEKAIDSDYRQLIASLRYLFSVAKQYHMVDIMLDTGKLLNTAMANRPSKKNVRAMWARYDRLYLTYVAQAPNVRTK